MKQPVGVILAGGQATRMGGGDKALLPLGKGVVLDQILDRLLPQIDGAALNANGDPARWGKYGLPVVGDSIAEFPGPLAGVLAGMDWAASQGADSLVTVAGDTPFFPADLVPQLLLAAEVAGTQIALAGTVEGDRTYRHPTFGLWPVALRDDLRQALADGTRKVVQWTDKHGAATAMFPTPDFDPFFNINTPEDLAKAQALL